MGVCVRERQKIFKFFSSCIYIYRQLCGSSEFRKKKLNFDLELIVTFIAFFDIG